MVNKTSNSGFDIKKEMLGNIGELQEKLPVFITETVRNQLKRDGIVIGVSGGVDSALIATLAVEALGPDHVYGLILPEKESSPSSRELALKLCKKLKIPFGEVPITPMLESFNIYHRKEALLRELFPQVSIRQSIPQTCFSLPASPHQACSLYPQSGYQTKRDPSEQNAFLPRNT